MPTTFANTIDGNEILAKRSQCDYAGADIQQTYATKSELPSASQLVPTSTSADADKVLTVDSQGIPGWAAVSASDVFVAKYNTTTWTDVSTAYADGKVIFLEVTDASIPFPYRMDSTAQIPLAAIRTGSVGAFAVFIGSSLGSTAGTGENTSWNVYILGSNDRWTTQVGKIYPSFTSSDFNKVLSVVDNGNNSPVLQWATPAAGGVTDVEVDGTSVVSGGVASITMPTVDQTYDASSTNAQSGTAVAGALSTKQDTISDLATIRSGAADGATAVQPGDLATVATTGSYSDLTGAPTILPYKPVVAGAGVRIVDDTANNRIVVEADETVLWESQDSAGHQTVTLSESKDNFERIKILVATNNGTTYGLFHEIPSNMANFNVIRGKGATNVWMSWIRLEFTNDTTLTVVSAKSFNFGAQSATSWVNPSVQVSSTEDIQVIWKVVGVHRIASN